MHTLSWVLFSGGIPRAQQGSQMHISPGWSMMFTNPYNLILERQCLCLCHNLSLQKNTIHIFFCHVLHIIFMYRYNFSDFIHLLTSNTSYHARVILCLAQKRACSQGFDYSSSRIFIICTRLCCQISTHSTHQLACRAAYDIIG